MQILTYEAKSSQTKVRFTNSWQTEKNVVSKSLLASNFIVLINTNRGNFGLIFSFYLKETIWLFWWLFWENLKFSDIFRKYLGIFQKSLFCRYSIADLVFDLFCKQKIWRQQTSSWTTIFLIVKHSWILL